MDRHFNLIYVWIIFIVIAVFMMSCKTKKGASSEYSNQSIKLIIEHFNSESQKWRSENEFEKKGVIVRINPNFYDSKFQKEGNSIGFNFFPQESYKGSIDKVNTILDGQVKSIYGSLISPYQGYYTISIEDEKILGNISVINLQKFYRISYSSSYNNHVVVEIDKSLLDIKEDSVLIPPQDSTDKNK